MQELNLRKVAGLILWWAEGTKSRRDKRWKNAVTYPLEMTSTDPNAIILFLDFIRNELNVDNDKLKLQLQIHENDNIKKLESYWSGISGISKDHFQKTIIRPVGNKLDKTKGTCKIRCNNKAKYLQAKEMLDTIIDDLIK